MTSSLRIVIFAKAPLPGFAKSRLANCIGPDAAAGLAKRMLLHTLQQALEADVGDVELCVTPSAQSDCWQSFEIPAHVSCSDQAGGDLGNRMATIAEHIIKQGQSVLLIGTDCPALNAGMLQLAANALTRVDAAIVPASDGGYVLLGLNRFHAALFENIPWSTNRVAEITQQRLESLNWQIGLLPTLNDIDTPEDLKKLPAAWHEHHNA
ncbi:MAG: TIGR04282 family arsenosugar biosynthesis glycosyltransferase [Gammaproteobacteria bacterium]